MRAIALLCALCALAAMLTAVVATTGAGAVQATPAAEIARYQRITWHWQDVMGVQRTASSFSPTRSTDPAYRQWVLGLWQRRADRLRRQAGPWMSRQIRVYQAQVGHWRHVMGAGPLRQTASSGGRELTFLRWRELARRIGRQAGHPPYLAAWRCIHHYEGSWTDSRAPYYGGLQMDLRFQQRYGGYLLRLKGTAEHWTPLEQMWVAARAHRSGRGFYPWPNTARACGLL